MAQSNHIGHDIVSLNRQRFGIWVYTLNVNIEYLRRFVEQNVSRIDYKSSYQEIII